MPQRPSIPNFFNPVASPLGQSIANLANTVAAGPQQRLQADALAGTAADRQQSFLNAQQDFQLKQTKQNSRQSLAHRLGTLAHHTDTATGQEVYDRPTDLGGYASDAVLGDYDPEKVGQALRLPYAFNPTGVQDPLLQDAQSAAGVKAGDQFNQWASNQQRETDQAAATQTAETARAGMTQDREDARNKFNQSQETGRNQARINAPGNAQVVMGADGKPLWADPKARTFTDAGGQLVTPDKVQRLGGGTNRSATAMWTQKFLEENPNATADDLSKGLSNFGSKQKATTAWLSGPLGQNMVALDTAVNHMDLLKQLAGALDNGDSQSLNKMRNAWRTEFGSDLPTNANAALPLVAGEMAKVIAGARGGTEGERAELQNGLTLAGSKRQMAGAANTQMSLLAGKMVEQKRNFMRVPGVTEDDWNAMLSPIAARELGALAPQQGAAAMPGGAQPVQAGAAPAPAQIKSDADFNALPSGAEFIAPDGSHRRKP